MLPYHDIFIKVLFPRNRAHKYKRIKFEAIRVNVSKWTPIEGTTTGSEWMVKCTVYFWGIVKFSMYSQSIDTSTYKKSLSSGFSFSSAYAAKQCRTTLSTAKYMCDTLYTEYFKPKYTFRVTKEVSHCAGCTTSSNI